MGRSGRSEQNRLIRLKLELIWMLLKESFTHPTGTSLFTVENDHWIVRRVKYHDAA